MELNIYSRRKIEELIENGKLGNTAIISFYDPEDKGRYGYGPVDFKGRCDRVIKIAIYDLDIEALKDFGLTVECYFPEADSVAEFVYKARGDGLNIICQCEYGQSRSAGCAAAILQHFADRGIDVFVDYRYYPNQLVYHKVYDALERYKKSLHPNT